MLVISDFNTQNMLYILAAVGPALALMFYVNKQDKVEKEPAGLLLKLFIFGALATIPAVLLETVSEYVEIWSARKWNMSMTSVAILDALFVGLIEEGCKYCFLRLGTWKNKAFNYRFDGIVYAVFVSLGFAALENVLYIFSYGLDIFLARAVLSIPAHMSFAVYMGLYYGRAKYCERRGNMSGCSVNLWAGYLLAVLLHTIYDGTLMVGTDLSMIMFYLFDALMVIAVFRVIRNEAKTDRPLY